MTNLNKWLRAIETALESIDMELQVFEYETFIVREVATGEIFDCHQDEMAKILGMSKNVFFNLA